MEKLDVYEDSRMSVEDRVNDLVSQMTLEEKAGSMFFTMIGMTPEGKPPFELPSSREAVENQKEDLPYDPKDPLYPFGYGLSYPAQNMSM